MSVAPLSGVRIADFTWAGAGPYGTLLLAFRGAEVIKIGTEGRGQGWSLNYIDFPINVHKKSISLDLKTPEGRDLAKGLVAKSDLVTDNFRPGVMEKLGLGYEELRKVKEDIIMVEVSALGASGPHSHYAGYAPIFSALGGLANLTGYHGGNPSELRLMVDYMAGTAGAFIAQAALARKKMTGKGCYIDASIRELCSFAAGEAFLDHLVNSRIPPKMGNRDAAWAPHGVYRCKGEDAWISIAVTTEKEWRALCKAMGKSEMVSDSRFMDTYKRWNHQEELDRIINDWTANYEPFALMHSLQKAGVAAAPSFSNKDIFEDPHIKERNYYMTLDTGTNGSSTMFQAPWMFDGVRPPITTGAHNLGQDNHEVFVDLLGLTPQEMETLAEKGVIK